MKKGIIVLFHGSRAPGTGEAAERIVQNVRERWKQELILCAYLQHQQPTFREAVEYCVLQGVDEITTVPFFLQTGSHVTGDIPRLLDEARVRYPGLSIVLTDAVGSHPRMADVIMDLAGCAEMRPQEQD